MIKKSIKKFINNILTGVILPVFSSQLRGMWLKVDPLMPGNLFFNNVEEEVHNVYNIFIKRGFTVLDVGANVGLHSYYIARHFENSKVYAFEPFPGNASYIRKMLSVNKISNITLIEKALGEVSGNSYFNTAINNHQGHLTEQQTEMVVDMVSLDSFIEENNVKPDFIKLDVEGGESAVLQGFKKNISALYPTIIVEVHNTEQAKKVADFFRPLEYTLCKLVALKQTNSNRPFVIIDNVPSGEVPPVNMHGQIVAIPNKIFASYSSFIYKA